MGASNSTGRGPEERGCFARISRPSQQNVMAEAEVRVDKENMRVEAPRTHENIMPATEPIKKSIDLKTATPVARHATKPTPTKAKAKTPAKERTPVRMPLVRRTNRSAPQPPAKLLKTFTFRWTGDATTVAVAGSFSGWSTVSLEKVGDREFVAELELKPKRYEYKFVVDGVWQHDPSVPVVSSGLGSLNNVIDLPANRSLTSM
eukprot:m.434423 g.434423  ORF g.434423 m.434423 type:complete len:204 (+) comp17712_c0_seq1:65-676(+)